ncbi:unnamed protein product [Thlaspi arvense]|uniref:SP-RING-type domain-containing protein n=1 Tax=Thlaspi arvense TaxID=13288 RepID=A0AAU9TA24_THLAR|nr:unnamed protein product [Thlaspi arvense]
MSTTVRPAAGPGVPEKAAGTGVPEKAAAALVNSFRLASVTQRLRYHIDAGPRSDAREFQICCISLAKGIDFAIANNEIPKNVCRHRTDVYCKTAAMVLMISIKHACKLGWFSESEGQELIALADEMKNTFGSPGNTSPGVKSPGGILSQIIERFFPFVKLGHVLVSLEGKAGFTMLAHDFHISKNMPHSLLERIRLFVVQTDNIDTSACIINPPEVSFLLNGKMVEKRVNITMDSGPQIPTNVTAILKYGTNLLQVMGNSKGHYIIVIAFTGLVKPPEKPVLKDYLQSAVIESNPDSDIIEGPSRVSLKCPISRSRIKLPVKGQLCRHLQCFDFYNYVHINMRIPSWRCPHCNQSVCYPEIRLDQNMILKDAGPNAADVIIHASGTWKVAKENDGTEEPVRDVIIHDLEDPTSFLNAGPVVLDLTGDDDDAQIDLFGDTKVVEQKPRLSDAQGQPSHKNASKDASEEDYSSLFDISDAISFDQVMRHHLNTGTGQDFSNLSQISMPQDPTPVPAPFSQTPSPRDRPATTSTGTYLGTTSTPRWIQNHTSQAPPITPSLQSRRHPVPITSQSPGNASSFAQSTQIPRVLTNQQPNSNIMRNLNRNHSSTQRQRPSSPAVQSVSRTSDLMDVDLTTTPDLTNWRPRMRGSLTPGSYSPALDHMIIRPTQQLQTRLHGSQPVQTPPVQTSQAQPPFSTAPPCLTRPSGPTAPWRT